MPLWPVALTATSSSPDDPAHACWTASPSRILRSTRAPSPPSLRNTPRLAITRPAPQQRAKPSNSEQSHLRIRRGMRTSWGPRTGTIPSSSCGAPRARRSQRSSPGPRGSRHAVRPGCLSRLHRVSFLVMDAAVRLRSIRNRPHDGAWLRWKPEWLQVDPAPRAMFLIRAASGFIYPVLRLGDPGAGGDVRCKIGGPLGIGLVLP